VICLFSGNRINAVVVAINVVVAISSLLQGVVVSQWRLRRLILNLLLNYSWNVIFSTWSLESKRRNFIINHCELFYHNKNDHIVRAATPSLSEGGFPFSLFLACHLSKRIQLNLIIREISEFPFCFVLF